MDLLLQRCSQASRGRKLPLINIKLDKTGGLTHALELIHAARERGLALLVGSMAGSSLAMAPAFSLDGPLLLQRDRFPGMTYVVSCVTSPPGELWG